MTYQVETVPGALAELKMLGYTETRATKIMRIVLHDGSWSDTVAGLPIMVDRRGPVFAFTY